MNKSTNEVDSKKHTKPITKSFGSQRPSERTKPILRLSQRATECAGQAPRLRVGIAHTLHVHKYSRPRRMQAISDQTDFSSERLPECCAQAQTVLMKIKNPDRPYYSSARSLYIYIYMLHVCVGLCVGAWCVCECVRECNGFVMRGPARRRRICGRAWSMEWAVGEGWLSEGGK